MKAFLGNLFGLFRWAYILSLSAFREGMPALVTRYRLFSLFVRLDLRS